MHELLALERSGWDALCAGTGPEFYHSLMLDGAVMVLANGSVLAREEVLSTLSDASPRWQTYGLREARLLDCSDTSTTLVYMVNAYKDHDRDHDNGTFVAVATSVYVRTHRAWRLALHQQTPVPAPSTIEPGSATSGNVSI